MDKERMTGDLLGTKGLKKTRIRIEILEVFKSHNFALSASDIIARMKAGNDRVTIYRALTSFEEHGILHKASEDGNGAKYALCNHKPSVDSHDNQHVHFVCDECHKTYCLEEVVVPEVKISNEFLVDRTSYTLHGVCSGCRAKS